MATRLKISPNRLNMVDPLPAPQSYGFKSGIFKPRRTSIPFRSALYDAVWHHIASEELAFMQQGTQAAEFDIEEARRVLGDVFAPWVQDLGLSIARIDSPPPPPRPP